MANNGGDQRIARSVSDLVDVNPALGPSRTLEAKANAVKPPLVSGKAGSVSSRVRLTGKQHFDAHYLALCCLYKIFALRKRVHRF